MKIFIGDITKIDADAIGVATNNCIISGNSIIKKIGLKELKEYIIINKKYIKKNEILITPGFKLNKNIIFFSKDYYFSNKTTIKDIIDIYKLIIDKSVLEGYKKIVLPIIGNGPYGYKNDVINKEIIPVILDYINNKDILVIINMSNKKIRDYYTNI